MEITVILQWLTGWILFVLAQSIFINGIYQSATGETKKRVDGSYEDSEMILYQLKKFFEKTKRCVFQYKKSGSLLHLINQISPKFKEAGFDNYNIIEDGIKYNTKDSLDKFKNISHLVESDFGVMVVYESCVNKITFYKFDEKYVYSKWLRKPIIQCIKCMSSFWGILTFWPVVLFLFGFNWLEIPVFFADMFSLTYINWILYKKAQ